MNLEGCAHAESLRNMESQAESSPAQPSENESETTHSLSSSFVRICLVWAFVQFGAKKEHKRAAPPPFQADDAWS